METGAIVAVEVPLVGDERRKNWAKVVHSVDGDKAGGGAYEGDFIATGGVQDVEAPCVVLVYGEKGSQANPRSEARVYLANTDGTLSLHATATGRAWARTLRDTVNDLLERDLPMVLKDWDPLLMRYTTEALRYELGKRETRSS